jgi:hypothetical protein
VHFSLANTARPRWSSERTYKSKTQIRTEGTVARIQINNYQVSSRRTRWRASDSRLSSVKALRPNKSRQPIKAWIMGKLRTRRLSSSSQQSGRALAAAECRWPRLAGVIPLVASLAAPCSAFTKSVFRKSTKWTRTRYRQRGATTSKISHSPIGTISRPQTRRRMRTTAPLQRTQAASRSSLTQHPTRRKPSSSRYHRYAARSSQRMTLKRRKLT